MNPHYQSVGARAGHRCEYCRAPEVIFNFPFEVEHIVPPSRGGDFNPRRDDWKTHFRLDIEHGAIDGLTRVGRATVHQLRLNAKTQRSARKQWVRIGLVP